MRKHPSIFSFTSMSCLFLLLTPTIVRFIAAAETAQNLALHDATMREDVTKIHDLTQTGANLENRYNGTYTALQIAVMKGKKESVRQLIKSGADIHVLTTQADMRDFTLLHLAAHMIQPHLFQLLYKRGLHLEAKSGLGFTALAVAVNSRHIESVKTLLKLGANPNAFLPVSDSQTNEQFPILGYAARVGVLEQVHLLVEAGAHLDTPGPYGKTPLHIAVEKDHLDIIEYLVKAGANIEAYGAANRCTPLSFAAELADNKKSVAKLIALGANLESLDKERRTPLTQAAFLGFLNTVKTLVTAGANINARSNKNKTPLLLASEAEHFEILQYLFEHGADINSTCCQNTNALHVAAHNERYQVMRLLVKLGIDIHAKMHGGYSPLQYVNNWNKKSLQLMIELGGNVNDIDDTGASPIHRAAEYGYVEAVKTLIAAGADIHKTVGSDNALTIATRNNHYPVKKILLDAGVKYPPTLIERMQQSVLHILTSTMHFVANPIVIMMNALLLVVLSGLYLRLQHLRQQELVRLEHEKFQNQLKQRDLSILALLKSMTKPFFPNSDWKQFEATFVFINRGKISNDYPLKASTVFSLMSQYIDLPYANEKTVDPELETIQFRLKNLKDLSCSKLSAAEIIYRIQSDLTELWHDTSEFRFNQIHKEISQFCSRVTTELDLLPMLLKQLETGKTIAIDAENDLSFILMGLNGVDPLTIRRVANALNSWQRTVGLFKKLDERQDIIPFYSSKVTKQHERLQELMQTLKQRLKILANEKITEDVIKNLNKQHQTLQANFFDLLRQKEAMQRGIKNLQLIPTYRSAIKDAIYDYNQEQKSIANIAAREQTLALRNQQKQEARVQAKQNTPQQNPKEKVQAKEIRIQPQTSTDTPKPEIKGSPAFFATASTSSSSTSSSSTARPINHQSLQQHILILGDLLQAYAESTSEQLDYKYALLAECLRLFELMKQFTFNATAIQIRNALMHNHRYIVIESIVAFAQTLAHTPSGERTHSNKLEDALRLPDNNLDNQYLQRLRHTLSKLRNTDLYQSHVHDEEEAPTARVYLETIAYLLDDLHQIQIKQGSALADYPNKVRAIKGILFCIGECQQRLLKFPSDDLLIRQFIQCKNNRGNGLHKLIRSALSIREILGHATADHSETNDEDLLNEAKQLEWLRLRASTMKEALDHAIEPTSRATPSSSY